MILYKVLQRLIGLKLEIRVGVNNCWDKSNNGTIEACRKVSCPKEVLES